MPKTIRVKRDSDGVEFDVDVEEYHPYEPSAYCWSAGWSCYYGITEFFVDEGGIVWIQPSNDPFGIAPEIKAASDRFEAQIAEVV